MFQRPFLNAVVLIAIARYKGQINEATINSLSSRKIKNILIDEDCDTKNALLHYVLYKYNKRNYEESFFYLDRLKRIIKRHNIDLSIKEEQFLQILEERIFAKERNLKILDTNYKLEKGENLYVHYSISSLYSPIGKKLNKIVVGKLLITSKRIIIQTENLVNDYYFYLQKIRDYNYTSYGFEFNYGSDKYLIRIHDQPTLNNILEQMWKKVK